MGYPTASAVWPSSQPSTEIRQLVDHFFTLADSKADDAGERFAKEVFTRDGLFILANGTFEGTAEISRSRKDAWVAVKSRRHEVSKVYVNDIHGTDLFLIGILKMETLDGTESSREFVARMKIEKGDSHAARISQYRIVTPAAQDPRPILDAE